MRQNLLPMLSVFLLAMGASLVIQAESAFDALAPNAWKQIPLSGEFPGWGVEQHLDFDTSGNMYMLGSCSYGGMAEGTHNNDIFRFNIKTGITKRLYSCGNNPWRGGCQAGQVYDPSRNCIWFGPPAGWACATGITLPDFALFRMQCPDGPIEKASDKGLPGRFYLYDPANDLLISVKDDNYSGFRLDIYDIKKDSIYVTTAPISQSCSQWYMSTCFDTKRGLVVITRVGPLRGPYGWDTTSEAVALKGLWFYNTTTKQWSSKTPSVVPPPVNVSLTYEPISDKYVLIGTDVAGIYGTGDWHTQVWVYDYDSNIWTERPRGSSHYDTLNRANSTWPPARAYAGSFGFSPKDGVIANWAGLPTNFHESPSYKENFSTPLWVFKLGPAGNESSEIKAVSTGTQPRITLSPNPFVAEGLIQIALPTAGTLTLEVLDLHGRLVKRIASGVYTNGCQTYRWDGTGPDNRSESAGVYLIRLKSAKGNFAKRLVLAR